MRSTLGRWPSSLRTSATAISVPEMATAARRPSVRLRFLNTRLSREPEGDPLLCLVARHVDGPMAICIDGVIPSLHSVDVAHIVPSKHLDLETLGSFTDEGQEIDIVALQRLGRHRRDHLES